MKRVVSMCGALIVAGTAGAQSVVVNSFDQNGLMAWTAPSGSVCTVEWASSLTPTPHWSRSWHELTSITATNAGTSAHVPMFYRVTCWTNGLFLSYPLGRTYVYTVSNALGQAWTYEGTSLGNVTGPSFTNHTYVLVRYRAYGAINDPVGVDGVGDGVMGLSDSAAYEQMQNGREAIMWQNSPVGTTWTNDSGPGYGSEVSVWSVVSNGVSVSVPAGTFENCIVYRLAPQTPENPPPYDERVYYYVKPGLALVKLVDYWNESNAVPVISELESWRDE